MKTKSADAGKKAHPANPQQVKPAAQPFFQKKEGESHAAETSFFQAVQPKLRIGEPGNAYEREADAMADRVVQSGPEGETHGHSSENGTLYGQITPLVQRQEAEEDTLQRQADEEEELQMQSADEEEELQMQEEEEALQMQSADEEEELQMQEKEEELQMQEAEEEELQLKRETPSERIAPASAEKVLRARRHQGNLLPEPVRRRMERKFGADLSGVRIHTDGVAAQLSKALRARAFTLGPNIYFAEGEFRPGTRNGDHLLAHELTHTIQQGAVGERLLRPSGDTLPVQRQEQETYLIRPELLNAIALARGEIGKVNAKMMNPDGTRQGWERLYEYFYTAFGNKEVIHRDVIKYIAKLTKGDAMPHWCGIFVWWALKSSGVPMPDWKLGANILQHVVPRKPGELPRKGDIAYRDKNQHFAMVSGVEDPATAAGKSFQSILVATVNGNTAGTDNLGGQVEEIWEPISRWKVFMDPVGKLDMPPVPLVETGITPDFEEGVAGESAETEEAPPEPEAPEPEQLIEDVPEPEPEAPAAEAPTEEVDVALPPPATPPPAPEAPAVEALALEGPSDQAMTGFTEASPSQMAASFPQLGEKLDQKLGDEQQKMAEETPKLEAKTSGTVKEGLTPAGKLSVPGAEIDDGTTGPEPLQPELEPHENLGETPSNKAQEKKLDEQDEGGFLSWFKNNFRNFINSIRTKDPGVNTKAGERPKVDMSGEADPERLQRQRQDADQQLGTQRDTTVDQLKNHPGQENIQPKKVEEDYKPPVSTEKTVAISTQQDKGMQDYATAPLPKEVRDKADEKLQPGLHEKLNEAKTKTEEAAKKRDTDKTSEIKHAEEESARLNKAADEEQRKVVVDNRKKVAGQQEKAIGDAYGKVDSFRKEAGDKEKEADKGVREKIKSGEEKAKGELDKGERDAEAKKKEGEEQAAAKKKELEKEEEKQGFWDQVASAIKKAVKAITKAIDDIFNAIRSAVKTIIEKAKKLALDAIESARKWVVDKLNQFRDWAKSAVSRYLKDFPLLADAANALIDATVDLAIQGVNAAADALKAGIERLANALAAALDKILAAFQTALKAAVQIAGAVLTGDFAEALRIAVQAACDIAGIDSGPVFDFFNRAGAALMDILKDPLGFFGNLIEAVGGGVRNFAGNIKQHLISGLIGWLTGALSALPITLPETFDLKGIFHLVLQILGLTYEAIKARIIKKFPPAEKIFHVVETAFEIIKDVVTRGPIALWERAKEFVGNIKETVLGAIRNFVITKVIQEGIVWLLSLLNPASALVKALKLLFDFVMFLVRRFQQIKDFVLSVYNSVVQIATGKLGPAMKAVEDALARSVPVVISMLASLLGLGGIGQKVQEIIKKVTAPINKVIDSIIDKVIAFAKKVLKKGKSAAKKVKEKIVNWWKARKNFKSKDGKSHSIYFKGKGKSDKLIVESSPRGLRQLINEKLKAVPDKDKPALLRAKKELTTIDGLVDQITKAQKAKGKDADTTSLQKKITDSLDTIAIELIGTGVLEDESLPPTNVTFALSGGKADKVEGFPVTKIPGNTKGSSPTAGKSDPPGWTSHVAKIPNYENAWVRAHLLNENLHGPALPWNLVPGTKETNNSMKSEVETKAKKEVLERDRIIYWSTNVDYYSGDDLQYFPKAVTITWGQLYRKGAPNQYDKGPNLGRTWAQEKPDLTNIHPSLSQSSAGALKDVFRQYGVSPLNVADQIMEVRRGEPGQVFRNELHFVDSMNIWYHLKGKSEDWFGKKVWPNINKAIVAGDLKLAI